MIYRAYAMGILSGILIIMIIHSVFATYFLDMCV